MPPHCVNVAELGVGLNPNARLTRAMLDDEGVVGAIHIGTSFTLGGQDRGADPLRSDPAIEVDQVAIQRDRERLV